MIRKLPFFVDGSGASFRPTRKRKPTAKAKSAKQTRHIPNAIKREVYDRDGGQCTFFVPNGHRCEAQSRLELHHLKPWGMGGVHSAANIALGCRTHNRLAADADCGAPFMRDRVQERGWNPRGPGCHGPTRAALGRGDRMDGVV